MCILCKNALAKQKELQSQCDNSLTSNQILIECHIFGIFNQLQMVYKPTLPQIRSNKSQHIYDTLLKISSENKSSW